MCAITRSCAAAAADMLAGQERRPTTEPQASPFPCLMEPKVFFAGDPGPRTRKAEPPAERWLASPGTQETRVLSMFSQKLPN